MKKFILIPTLLLVVCFVFTGCMGTGGAGSNPQPSESSVVYNTVEEFKTGIAAMKASDAADEHALKTIDSYYTLKELPQDAKVVGVKVASFFVRVQYTFGKQEPQTFENKIDLIWYRNTNGTNYINKISSDGNTYDEVKGKDLTYLVTKAKVKSETDPNATRDYCQIVYWSQDSQAYMAAVPLSFTHDDILKYCIAQKATVG